MTYCYTIDQYYQLVNENLAWISSDYTSSRYYSLSNVVWIDWPLMLSSDVTTPFL